jgi:hypothetical protein
MDEEMAMLDANATWELIVLLKDKRKQLGANGCTKSSMEAEYKSATIVTCEVIWLQKTTFTFGTVSGCSCCHLL